MASKRKAAAMTGPAAEEPVDPADQLTFLCLGGGNEVGRSCHVIQYKGKTVMLDAGQHPAYSGFAALPFFDDFDLSTVDVLLISHFHIDHAASLPYVLAKTNFRGRVFMTHPTKAIYKWLIQDSVRVGNSSSNPASQPLYTEQDHLNTFPMIEAIDYHTTHTISSIRITPYPAGHVLGAAMFLVEIAGLNIFFTGDYSREQDRHLVSAEVPRGVRIDVLITESTYGVASHVPRVEREQALMKSITSILNRGGHVLMPVFALGRAQELLLILDEFWAKHPEYQKYPIYYASSLARKCMLVYQTYVGAMNDNIKRLFRERLAEAEAAGDASNAAGPWDFRHIRSLKNLDRFDDMDRCVMLAAPGMLQSGVSRELLERWAPSDKNGVIITGYSVEGTMARQILSEPDSIQAVVTKGGGAPGGARRVPGGPGEPDKIIIPRRCSIDEYSFAAHVDGVENREFIEEVGAPVVILVHGEQHAMMRLKSKLLSLNANKETKVKVFSPRNCEELKIPFKADKLAKVVGKLASINPPPPPQSDQPPSGHPVPSSPSSSLSPPPDAPTKPIPPQQQPLTMLTGVLVQNDFKLSLMAPEDLREYAGLNTTAVVCRHHMSFPHVSSASIELVRWTLECSFGAVDDLPEARKQLAIDSAKTKNADTITKDGQNGSAVNEAGGDKMDEDTDGDSKQQQQQQQAKPESEDTKKKEDAEGDHDMDAAAADEVENVEDQGPRLLAAWLVMGCIKVWCYHDGGLTLEWEGNQINDTLADAVISTLFTADTSPAAVKRSAGTHSHSHSHSHSSTDNGPNNGPAATPQSRLDGVIAFLQDQFGLHSVSLIETPKLDSSLSPSSPTPTPAIKTTDDEDTKDDMDTDSTPTPTPENLETRQKNELARLHKMGVPVPGIKIRVDDKIEASVWLENLEVECGHKAFGDRVRAVLERALEMADGTWE